MKMSTPEEISTREKLRADRRARMQRDMEMAMSDAVEIARCVSEHPLPWTWGIAFHDGWFYQFFDANGRPCLGDDLRDPEDAAFLLTMVNSSSAGL